MKKEVEQTMKLLTLLGWKWSVATLTVNKSSILILQLNPNLR